MMGKKGYCVDVLLIGEILWSFQVRVFCDLLSTVGEPYKSAVKIPLVKASFNSVLRWTISSVVLD